MVLRYSYLHSTHTKNTLIHQSYFIFRCAKYTKKDLEKSNQSCAQENTFIDFNMRKEIERKKTQKKSFH